MASGIVHIDEPNIPFGEFASGTANLEPATDTRRVTARDDIAPYPC